MALDRSGALRRRGLVCQNEGFLNPARGHHWSAAFCARAIADLCARYPRLRVVFCANRKIAEAWTRNYFGALSAITGGVSAGDESVILNGDGMDA
jgi:hypothetical protein